MSEDTVTESLVRVRCALPARPSGSDVTGDQQRQSKQLNDVGGDVSCPVCLPDFLGDFACSGGPEGQQAIRNREGREMHLAVVVEEQRCRDQE